MVAGYRARLIANTRRGEARRAALQQRTRAAAAVGADLGPDELAIQADGLMRAFASLSDDDQELLRLVAWDGLSRSEGARVLGISPSVFSVRLHRARRRLARALSDMNGRRQEPQPRSPAEVSLDDR